MTDIQKEFDALVTEYYGAWFRYHPEAAVDCGVEGYSDKLTPFDDDDMGALASLNAKILASLDEFDFDALEPGQQTDYKLLYGSALIERNELMSHDWRHRDPVRYLPVNAIYQLTVRPVENFTQSLCARVEQIPSYLRSARTHVGMTPERIPKLWLESAIIEARQGVIYFRELINHPKVSRAATSKSRLGNMLDKAAAALDEFARFLEGDIAPQAKGDFACGREHFEQLLHYRHSLDLDSEQLMAFGERLFAETERDLQDVARESGGDVASLTARIQADHPGMKELLGEYRQQMQAARDFVIEHELVTIPEKEELKVVDTPVFLRHAIPFAAYLDPAPNDPEQSGYYYVTPAVDDEQLAEHNRAGLMHTCVHEAWPGHHLQFVTANRKDVSRSLPRLLNASATMYEGWALYCEQMMQEEGFLNKPEQKFILLRDRLWRALRIIIDVKIQTQGMSIDEAADLMVKALGFPRSQAMADLNWYSRSPAVPMGYATGWALINASRDRLKLTEEEFTLRSFHDRLLAEGSIALPLVIRNQFGDGMWDTVHKMVFNND